MLLKRDGQHQPHVQCHLLSGSWTSSFSPSPSGPIREPCRAQQDLDRLDAQQGIGILLRIALPAPLSFGLGNKRVILARPLLLRAMGSPRDQQHEDQQAHGGQRRDTWQKAARPMLRPRAVQGLWEGQI